MEIRQSDEFEGDNSFVSPVALKGECLKHHLFKTLLAQLILVYSSTQAALHFL